MALTKVAPAGIGSTPGDGYRIGSSFLHSTGVELTNANASGIVTAAQFDGKLNIGIATFTDDVTFTGAAANIIFDKSADDLIFNDGAKAQFGTGSDLRIYHESSSTTNWIEGAGLIRLQTSSGNIEICPKNGAEKGARFITDGASELYYDGTKRISTSGIGATVTGQLDVGNVNSTGVITATKFVGDIAVGSSITYADNEKAYFGTDLDGTIKHTGSNFQIQESTGNIQITNYANDKDVVINTDDGSGGTANYFVADGSTGESLLYHYGNQKIKTTSSGVVVTGQMYSDTAHVNGELDLVGNLDLNSDNHRIKIGAGDDFQLYHNGSNNFIETNNGDIRIKTSDSSGNLTFTAGGSTESARINSSGQVLIGTTTNPTTAKCSLRVAYNSSSSSGNAIEITQQTNGADKAAAALGLAINNGGASTNASDLIFSTATGGSLNERMRILYNGKVRIGGGLEHNPEGNLDIVGDNNSNGPELYLRVSNNNTTDNIGALLFGNNVDKSVCMIRASTHTANNTGNITFHTSNTGTMGERLRIMNDGRIGIKFLGDYTMNSSSTNLVIGDGGSGVGMTFWTASGADNQTISFQTNENLSRAEGEISYGPTGTSVTNDRNAMMFRTNSAERLRITSAGRIGVNNTEPGGRTGSMDLSSNDGSDGRVLTDQRHSSMLTLRNPSTTQHSYTQLLFTTGGGTAAATCLRHKFGSSKGSLQNFVGDLSLLRRVGNNGGANLDMRESIRWCGANEQSRQIWWSQGTGDTNDTDKLGWHHLSGQQDPGQNQYTYFRCEVGAASYSRQGIGKYTVVWTTGHASGYGYQIGHFGWYNHHGNSRAYVNDHIVQRLRYSNGSYYAWNDAPNMEIMQYTQSGGTNGGFVFRCEGRRTSGYDMGIRLGLFLDLYVPESSNGDTNPRLYLAGSSQSNLDGTVNRAFVSFQSSNPNHSGQP